jgi:protein SCO1/2
MRRAAVVAILLCLACSRSSQTAPKPVSERGEKLHTLKGTIVTRDTAENTLRVDHEAIPGFMDAMTMDYSVRGAKVSDLPPDRSRIEAKLHVVDDRYWISDVRKTQ